MHRIVKKIKQQNGEYTFSIYIDMFIMCRRARVVKGDL